ncbi:MAG TPA: hypothetical protein VNO52_10920 [Methylomirabilota bacterium]|nr:hypothetical protein [Methylomirabilota bacterium]
MGLDINAVQFLIAARRSGIDFGEVLTLGRQDLNVYPAKMVEVLRRHGFPAGAFEADAKVLFGEPVFRALGATRVSAMDFSDFEGAEFIHDLNQPIGPELNERFDLVYDGGTLEHVFNFPVALKNCMEMVRLGGRLMLHQCANNWCGHGFYQFSPELFFRALSPEHGFEVERLIVHRVGPYGRWFEVRDPEKIRSRVEAITWYPLQMLVQARRVRVMPIFARMPQQSDYTPRWTENQGGRAATVTNPRLNPYAPRRPWLARTWPGLARLLHVLRIGFLTYKNLSLWNRKCFRPVQKP